MKREILDDFLPPDVIAAARDAFPGPDWSFWFRYDSPDEAGKLTCTTAIPAPCREALAAMAVWCPRYVNADSLPDLTLWGAGMHLMLPGSSLGLHLDADRHAVWGLARIASSVLYLDTIEEGGELQFWEGGEVVKSVAPRAGRLVTFACTDDSYHSVARTPSVRRTLSLFWYAAARGPSKRPRALFVARPGEEPDPELEEARRLRSSFPTEARIG